MHNLPTVEGGPGPLRAKGMDKVASPRGGPHGGGRLLD